LLESIPSNLTLHRMCSLAAQEFNVLF